MRIYRPLAEFIRCTCWMIPSISEGNTTIYGIAPQTHKFPFSILLEVIMRIPSFKILKSNASQRVAAAENSGKIVLVYAGIITILSALVTIVNYTLNLQIAQTGGLSNMGLRSILSTIQSVLPMVQNLIVMCLGLGYMAAMVRISRQQYASEKTLKLGFDRFWVMLRYALIQSGIYMMVAMAAFWLSMSIYLITPLSSPVIELVAPYAADPDLAMTLLQDEVLSGQVVSAMLPLFLIFGVLYTVLLIPISYSLRMVRYVIIDKPAMGAMAAIRESRMMMKGSRMRLFRLDLSLWWWYAISVLSTILCYGDVLLAEFGIILPLPETVSYFLFFGLFLAVQFIACYFLRNWVEVVYAQAYNALKPREKDTGVVLGNIFQM